MTILADFKVVELQGRLCSAEELESLRIWAKSRIHWSATILQAVARQKGYLLEIDAASFTNPQWYGVDFDDVEETLRMTYMVAST
jgi:hypothetical protein